MKRVALLLAVIAPGMLVAATGVGAGDLATATFTGSRLGTDVLWAVVLGGVFKFALTEGLARWQLVTGETFLEGLARDAGNVVAWVFLPYLLLWSFFVGSALMSACGVTLHALIPLFDDAVNGKIAFGILSSAAGLILVRAGGFQLFEKVMGVCIGFMFVISVIAAVLLWPGFDAVVRGLLIPRIPDAAAGGVTWTVALIGGVGGTVTILCYGYWIREKGRTGPDSIRTSRIDLAAGYAMTIIFGLAMVIIGSTIRIEGSGAGLLIELGEAFGERLGPAGRWIFLVGAFGAVFSSLLGVWQAIPYLFADLWYLVIRPSTTDTPLAASVPYRGYMWGIAIIPVLGLFTGFRQIQLLYAVVGAAFIPLLAAALLVMNGRRARLGAFVNGWPTVAVLGGSLLFFAYSAIVRLM